MEMGRIVISTFFVFNMILVPSLAYKGFPFFYPRIFDPLRNAGGYEPQQPQDIEQQQQQPIEQQVGQEQPVEQPEFQNNNNNNGLQEGFYRNTCPNAEQIVADAVAEIYKTNPGVVATLIRLNFHDCFVGGCDASILLDSMPNGDNVEKSSFANGALLRGADVIDDIKLKLEQQCPQTVSCADTLAFAAREAMAIGGLPRVAQPGGRRDGVVSLAANVDADNLPLPNWSMEQILQLFKNKGFTEEEMVVLNGAHSVGGAHCGVFSDRLYNFQKSGLPDPALLEGVLNELRQVCPAPGTTGARNPLVDFDETPAKLDNLFYKNLVDKKKALLATDQALLADPRTAPIVQKLAADPNEFRNKFAEAMIKLGSLEVITGNRGEVRKTCRSNNN